MTIILRVLLAALLAVMAGAAFAAMAQDKSLPISAFFGKFSGGGVALSRAAGRIATNGINRAGRRI